MRIARRLGPLLAVLPLPIGLLPVEPAQAADCPVEIIIHLGDNNPSNTAASNSFGVGNSCVGVDPLEVTHSYSGVSVTADAPDPLVVNGQLVAPPATNAQAALDSAPYTVTMDGDS